MKWASKARYLCSELVKVEWRNDAGATAKTGILEEIWAEGACVQSAEPLRIGTRVRILARRVLFLETVMECALAMDGYCSQLKFDEDSRWSSRRYKPEHMVSTS